MTVREYCPVGELAGNRHRYDVGTGVVIPWHVAGDPRSGVEACRSCVEVAEPCVSCGATNDGEVISDDDDDETFTDDVAVES